MSVAAPLQAQAVKPKPVSSSTRSGLMLQRKCACGAGASSLSGECAECSSKKIGLQAKLRINQPGDVYEQEADRVAEQVLAKPAHPGVSSVPPRIQRYTGRATGQTDMAPASVVHALAGSGRPLDPALRHDMEQRFGHDFSRVRVHSGGAAEQSAHDVNAYAYTAGHNIVFGAGRFAPGTNEGQRLIAHELTHMVQQSGSAAAVQRAPTPAADPSAERAAAVAEAEATLEQLERQSEVEDALRLEWSKRKDKNYAWSLGLKDNARTKKKGYKLSPKLQQEITRKLNFFEGEAKGTYLRTIGGALSEAADPEQIIEILAGRVSTSASGGQEKHEFTCDAAQKKFPLLYEGVPGIAECMDIRTDPEYKNNFFDTNIDMQSAVGYAMGGTTWENVEYDRFNVMLVKYKNGTSEYFVLDEVGNFYYGGKTLIILDHAYLKRKNGLVYPVYNGRIYFSEILTPNIISLKNGLQYQIKELKSLYDLLEAAGTFASIMGAYAIGEETFKTSINAFSRRPSASLSGSPLTGRVKKSASKTGAAHEPHEPAAPPAAQDKSVGGPPRKLLGSKPTGRITSDLNTKKGPETVYEVKKASNDPDTQAEVRMAEHLDAEGHQVHFNAPTGNKPTADLTVDGVHTDVKNPKGASIKSALISVRKQGSAAIDGTSAKLSEADAEKGLKEFEAEVAKPKHPPEAWRDLKTVYILLGNGKVFTYHRTGSPLKVERIGAGGTGLPR